MPDVAAVVPMLGFDGGGGGGVLLFIAVVAKWHGRYGLVTLCHWVEIEPRAYLKERQHPKTKDGVSVRNGIR